MCFDAHFPNAAEPPALFNRDTRIPSITRNTRIPAFPESESFAIIPPFSLNSMVLIPNSRLKFEYNNPPVIIPASNEV